MTAGIRWLSVGPGSGYGNASEAYLSGLRAADVGVTWTPIGWPSSTWDALLGPITDFTRHGLEGAIHLDIANRELRHDAVVVHSTPLWHRELASEAAGRRLIAFTTWETDRLWPDWVAILNRYDRVLVPSTFNANAFASSGVTAPLAVVPHIARAPGIPVEQASDDDQFTFYTIGPWTTRKAMLDLVSAYLSAFTADDPVHLVVHTTPEDLIARARLGLGSPAADHDRTAAPPEAATWFALARALAGTNRTPAITLSTNRLTQKQIDALHARGDCFVCLSRGEGWGLGAFEAAAAGNPVIVTGWGGTLDFLPADYPYCVAYDLVPTITDRPDAWWGPQAGEFWAKARIDHAAALMRQVFEQPDEAKTTGAILRSSITGGFSEAEITRRLIDAVTSD